MFASLFGAACAAVSMSMSFAQPTLLASAMLRISCVLSSLHLDHLPQVLLPLAKMTDYGPISDDELHFKSLSHARLSLYLAYFRQIRNER